MSQTTLTKDLDSENLALKGQPQENTHSTREIALFSLHPNNFVIQRIYAPIYRNLWQFIISIFAFWILYYQTCTRYFGGSEKTCDLQVQTFLFSIQVAMFLLWCYAMWLKQK
ncbi:hypothetical protein BDV10DRAFT_163969 [Aspergillus recurvatus]